MEQSNDGLNPPPYAANNELELLQIANWTPSLPPYSVHSNNDLQPRSEELHPHRTPSLPPYSTHCNTDLQGSRQDEAVTKMYWVSHTDTAHEIRIAQFNSQPLVVYTARVNVPREDMADIRLHAGASSTDPVIAFGKKHVWHPEIIGLGDPERDIELEYLKKRPFNFDLSKTEHEFESSATLDGARRKFVWTRHMFPGGYVMFTCYPEDGREQIARALPHMRKVWFRRRRFATIYIRGSRSGRFVQQILVSWLLLVYDMLIR